MAASFKEYLLAHYEKSVFFSTNMLRFCYYSINILKPENLNPMIVVMKTLDLVENDNSGWTCVLYAGKEGYVPLS